MNCGANGDCNGHGEFCEISSGPGPGSEEALIRDLVSKLMGLVNPCCNWGVLGIMGAVFLVTVCLCVAVCYCYCCRSSGRDHEKDDRHHPGRHHRSPVRSKRRGDFEDDDEGIALGPATGEFDLVFDPDYVPPPRSPRGAGDGPHTRDGIVSSPRRAQQSGPRSPRPRASERRGVVSNSTRSNKKVPPAPVNEYAAVPPMHTSLGSGDNRRIQDAGSSPSEYDHVPALTWDPQAVGGGGRKKSPRSPRRSASGRRAATASGTSDGPEVAGDRIRAKLVPCNPNAICQEIPLSSRTKQLKLGRSGACDHRVHASFVSKIHCLIRATTTAASLGGRFLPDNGDPLDDDDDTVVTFTVEDNSTNGTYLNGKRLEFQAPHVLQVGDELALYPPNSSEVADDEDLRYRFVTLMDTANQASGRRASQQSQQQSSLSTPPPYGGVGHGVAASASSRPEFGPKPAAPPPRATLTKRKQKKASLKATAAAVVGTDGYQPLPASAAEASSHSQTRGSGVVRLSSDAVIKSTAAAPDEWASIVVSNIHPIDSDSSSAADDGEAPPHIASIARRDRPVSSQADSFSPPPSPPAQPPPVLDPPAPSSSSFPGVDTPDDIDAMPGPADDQQHLPLRGSPPSVPASPPPAPVMDPPSALDQTVDDVVGDDGQEPTIFSPAPQIPTVDHDLLLAALDESGAVVKIEQLTDDEDDDDDDDDDDDGGINDLVNQIVGGDDPVMPPPVVVADEPGPVDFDDSDDDEQSRFTVIEVQELGKAKRVQFTRETLMEEVLDLIGVWAEKKRPGIMGDFRFRGFKLLDDGKTLRRIPDNTQLWPLVADGEKIVVKLPKSAVGM